MIKNKLKKILTIALALTLTITNLPTKVLASETNVPTRLTMLDVSGLSETKDMLDSEGWKWVPTNDGGTLTFRNCYIQSQDTSSLHLPAGNVTIILEGENTIETKGTLMGAMIWSDPVDGFDGLNLTIVAGTKDGKLNMLRKDTSNNSNPYAIGGNSITIQSGDIYSNVEFCVIKSNFVMQGGSLKIDVPDLVGANGIYSNEGNVNISGGNLDIDVNQIGIYIPGILNEEEQKVSLTGGNIKINGRTHSGVCAKNITINTEKDVDIQGGSTALYGYPKGGTLEILAAGSLTLGGAYQFLPKQSNNDTTVRIESANYRKVDAAIEKANALNPDDYISSLSDVKAAVAAVVTGKKVVEQNIVNEYATAIEHALAALEYKDADYSKVDEAIAKIPADLSLYSDESVNVLNVAKNAVIRGKNISEQGIVDAYATAIENALKNLEVKLTTSIINPEYKLKIEYEDGSNFETGTELKITSKSQEEMDTFKSGIEKVAPGFVLGGLYDISLMKDGLKIQPNGKLRISLQLSDTMKTMEDLQVVYISDDGSVTVIPSEVKNGHIIFITNHLSYYGVIGKIKDTNASKDTSTSNDKDNAGSIDSISKSPKTGDTSSVTLVMMMLFISYIAFVKLRKRSKILNPRT